MIELQENGKLKLENYGLMEWALDVQTAIKQGYELDHSNEGYCQNFGSLYTCLMVESVSNPLKVEIDKEPQLEQKDNPPIVAQEVTIVAEKETEVKRGPKPKNK